MTYRRYFIQVNPSRITTKIAVSSSINFIKTYQIKLKCCSVFTSDFMTAHLNN